MTPTKWAKVTVELMLPLMNGHTADKDVVASVRDALGDFQSKFPPLDSIPNGSTFESDEWEGGTATARIIWDVLP